MQTIQPNRPFNRRDALKLVGIAGLTALGGYALYEYAPWLNYEAAADQPRRALQPSTLVPAQMLELVRFASLAASGHNTQPWKFAVKDTAIEIRPDFTRHLSAVDPHDRELWISLGCALENLLIAARASGYEPQVTYPDAAAGISVALSPASPQRTPLLSVIPERQNTRSIYNAQPLERTALRKLQAVALEPGVTLHFQLEAAEMANVLEYVNQGNLNQFADKAFVAELLHWLRFTKKEALASRDGLYAGASGNPQGPRWIGQLFVGGTKPQQQADSDAKKLRSSSGTVIVASSADNRSAWVRVGQVYERLALEMTALGIKSAFLNQPIEVPDLRGQFQSAMKLGTSLPQLLMRYGYADPMPRSLRRPVQEMLV
jgi:hypothetical protein